MLSPKHVAAQGGAGAASSSVAGAPPPAPRPVAMDEGMLSPDPFGVAQDDPMNDSSVPDMSDALKTAPPQLKRWWNTQFGEELTVAKWLEWRKEMTELFEVVHDLENLPEQSWYVL